LDRIKIAYLTVNDPLDKRSWSGTTYYIGQALQKHVGDVDFLGPVRPPWLLDKWLRAVAKITRTLTGKEYNTKYSLVFSWYAARALKKKMRGRKYDCVVAPAASTEFSFFSTRLPSVYISDTTFELISNYYHKEFSKISPFSKWEGNMLEKRSLRKASLIIYSSEWAKASAIKDYGIPAQRIGVMPLGANMDTVPDRRNIYEKEKNGVLTLLYLAVEWDRKGGPIAFEALQSLLNKGVQARLIVCGCVPPPEFNHPAMEVIPFLNKNKQEDHERFIRLLSRCHFLILPTRADCSLLVACESNAYGMPAITTATGGVPDIVKDGVNGYCLPYEANGDAYAQLISEIFSDSDRYHRLIRSSRQRYEQSLNWEQWAKGFSELYEQHVTKTPATRRKIVVERVS